MKSTLCAALALAELMCNIGGNDIICSSNDDAQADIIFQEVNNMREQFDPKDKRTHKNLKGIFNLFNKSSVKKLSDKTKNKEGRNIDFAIIDEIHEMMTNVIFKSIEQSQSTKNNPGLIEITTEGFKNDGYLDKTLVYVRKILNKKTENPSILVWLYTQDNEREIWKDKNTHYKSNPSLGIVKKYHYLQDQMLTAKESMADRAFMLAKDFNVKQNNAAAWLTEADIKNIATYDLKDLKGCIAIGGVDLSETTDLTCAKAIVMKPGDDTKYILTKYFIPKGKILTGEDEDKKNYLEWAKQGLIEVTDGNENDFRKVTQWFLQLHKKYGIRFFKIGYDIALSKSWKNEMEDIGFDLEKVPQSFKGMSDGMKLLEIDLKSKLVNYNNNPVDKWCFENTAYAINDIAQIRPVKVESKKMNRIDGTVALIIAYAIYTSYSSEYKNMVR